MYKFSWVLLLLFGKIVCEDLPQRLTFDEINNSTAYAQISHNHRPNTSVTTFVDSFNYTDVTKGDDSYIEEDEGPLLVGFTGDPFRYSIPDEDYKKGIRHINPQSFNKNYRLKRSVFNLYNMLSCGTECDPLSYEGYGCYCGLSGSGWPTDGIDRCCQMHDQCYGNISCPLIRVYFQRYYWKCYRGEPRCASENYSRTENPFVNRCVGRLCECDRKFAMCVRRYQCPRRKAMCRSYSRSSLLRRIF